MQENNPNSWGEWSIHVLAELKRLNANYESLRSMNEEIKSELVKLSGLEEGMGELKAWKAKLDEVASPSQVRQLMDEVQDLKSFKTTAITVWAVIQFLTTIALAFLKL